jgi:hypothetical protein
MTFAQPASTVVLRADGAVSRPGWSAPFAVLVPQPPAINLQPSDQTVLLGGSALFSVGASGTTPLSYFWQRNGSAVAGPTSSPSIAVNTAQLSDFGSRFSCLVSNLAGTATTRVATLTVRLPGGQPFFVPGSSVRLINGQFEFTLAGAPGSNYEVQVSQDLQNWDFLESLTLTNSSADLLDLQTNLAERFYRAKLMP